MTQRGNEGEGDVIGRLDYGSLIAANAMKSSARVGVRHGFHQFGYLGF
jgi:hypothetical protein